MWPLATHLEVYQYQMSIWSLLLRTFVNFHFEKRFQEKKSFYFIFAAEDLSSNLKVLELKKTLFF
jgi:hypothetical protein